MALFRNDPAPASTPPSPVAKQQRPSTPANPADQHNIIGASTTIEGTLRSSGNVNISGTVNGNVEVEGRTIVMPGGVVEGEVASTSAEVGGTVNGRVLVRERLVLKASAVVEGDIRTEKLVIEDGATFNGKCEMGASARPSKREAAPLPGRRAADAAA